MGSHRRGDPGETCGEISEGSPELGDEVAKLKTELRAASDRVAYYENFSSGTIAVLDRRIRQLVAELDETLRELAALRGESAGKIASLEEENLNLNLALALAAEEAVKNQISSQAPDILAPGGRDSRPLARPERESPERVAIEFRQRLEESKEELPEEPKIEVASGAGREVAGGASREVWWEAIRQVPVEARPEEPVDVSSQRAAGREEEALAKASRELLVDGEEEVLEEARKDLPHLAGQEVSEEPGKDLPHLAGQDVSDEDGLVVSLGARGEVADEVDEVKEEEATVPVLSHEPFDMGAQESAYEIEPVMARLFPGPRSTGDGTVPGHPGRAEEQTRLEPASFPPSPMAASSRQRRQEEERQAAERPCFPLSPVPGPSREPEQMKEQQPAEAYVLSPTVAAGSRQPQHMEEQRLRGPGQVPASTVSATPERPHQAQEQRPPEPSYAPPPPVAASPPPSAFEPPAAEMRAFGGEDEEVQLIVAPFSSFGAINRFTSAVRALPGVSRATIRRFQKGQLQVSVEYAGVVPLAHRLQELRDFTLSVVQTARDRIEAVLESSEERAQGAAARGA